MVDGRWWIESSGVAKIPKGLREPWRAVWADLRNNTEAWWNPPSPRMITNTTAQIDRNAPLPFGQAVKNEDIVPS